MLKKFSGVLGEFKTFQGLKFKWLDLRLFQTNTLGGQQNESRKAAPLAWQITILDFNIVMNQTVSNRRAVDCFKDLNNWVKSAEKTAHTSLPEEVERNEVHHGVLDVVDLLLKRELWREHTRFSYCNT